MAIGDSFTEGLWDLHPDDDTHCRGWADLLVTLAVDGDTKTDCSVRVALPTAPDDNPWARRGDQWVP